MSKDTGSCTQCSFKCSTCHNYDKDTDFCKSRKIEYCSKKPKTEFAKCNDYLINEKLVMF